MPAEFPCSHGHGLVSWPQVAPSYLTNPTGSDTRAEQAVTYRIRSTSSVSETWRVYGIQPSVPGTSFAIILGAYKAQVDDVIVPAGATVTRTIVYGTHNVFTTSTVAARYKDNDLIGVGYYKLPASDNPNNIATSATGDYRLARSNPASDDFYWGAKLGNYFGTTDDPIGPLPEPPPLTLTQTGATATTVTAAWSDGIAATGYERALDGGAWTDLGAVAATTVTGLTEDTDYLLSVRGYTVPPAEPGFTAAWSSDGYTGLFDLLGTAVGGGSFVNPAPGGVAVAASSAIDSARGPEKALDHTSGGQYHSTWELGAWWRVDAGPGRAFTVNRLGLQGRDFGAQHPRNFVLEGSADATAWTTLYTAVNTGPNDNAWWSVPVTGAAGWRFLRIRSTGNNSSGDRYLVLGEVELWGTLADATAPTKQYVSAATITVSTTPAPVDPPPAAYRVVVRLGPQTWDVTEGDEPAYGPMLPLSFGWLVPEDSHGFPAQPDPETLSLELVTASAADMAGVDIGSPARVSIYTSPDPEARPLATFRGRVADLEATPTDTGGLRWRLLGVGYVTDLGTPLVGAIDWPSESGDARAARIMAEAGFPGWTADPIGQVFEARGPQAVTARSELEAALDAAVTGEGTPNGPAHRVLVHPNTDAAGDLDPAAPFAGSAVVRRTDHLDYVTAGLINRRTTWRRTRLLDAGQVTVDHPGGPTLYGDPRLPAYPPQAVPITDPAKFAELLLDTTPGYRWLTGDALRFELWADEAAANPLDWFYRDPASPPFPWSGRAVIVHDIAQAPDGSTTYAGMLSAARVILEPGGRLVVEFRLRPEIPADSTVTMRWLDEPPAATWADEALTDPAGTWFAYRTTPRP